jgi:adenylate cyclase
VISVRLPNGSTIEVPSGERLLDVIDEQELTGLPTACRGATCGTCLVRVHRGRELLEPAREAERQTLATLGRGPEYRLSCQLVCLGSGAVELAKER